MKRWPPALPKNDLCVDALDPVIQGAKTLLLAEELDEEERNVVRTIKPTNTTIAIIAEKDAEKKEHLVVSLEVERRIRFKTYKLLSSPPVSVYFQVPTRITHAAVNAISKRRAEVLANMLAHDFVVAGEEQHEFAEGVGAPKRELREIDPKRHAEALAEIHRMIRERILPLDAPGAI